MGKKKADRRTLKKEYLASGLSYRDLAAKYNISVSTISRWAKEDGWQNAKEQTAIKTDTKIQDAVAEAAAKQKVDVFRVADKLLRKLEEALDQEQSLDDPQRIRQYAAALKDIKDIRGDKGKQDAKEQRARITKLQQEGKKLKAQLDGDAQDSTFVVRLEGGLTDLAE